MTTTEAQAVWTERVLLDRLRGRLNPGTLVTRQWGYAEHVRAGAGWEGSTIDALAEFGLQSPPNHKAQNGRLSALIHDLGIAHPCGASPSTRIGTKASQAAVWTRNPSRCVNAAHRRAA